MTFEDWIGEYKNSSEFNDYIHRRFTELTDSIPALKLHRDFVETRSWGFGDRAFHYMWWLLLRSVFANRTGVQLCEIGVYKGQVVSLWQLIAQELHANARIVAISPFEGNTRRLSRIGKKLQMMFNSRYRAASDIGNVYENSDYLADVQQIFRHFALSETRLDILRGYSQDPAVINRAANQFDVIYIDGDHTYNAVVADIRTYAPRVSPGGFLVMDDASFFLPGSSFAKGIQDVARACEEIPAYGFTNVLNIGHNRVFRRNHVSV